MALHKKSEAIVLKKKNLPGQDVIITLFTHTEGKITAVAKGVKKITSRRSPHLQTGNLLHVMLNERKDRYYLQETNLLSGFSAIKTNRDKIVIQYTIFYLLDRILPDRQPEPAVYELTKKFIVDLAKTPIFSKEMVRDYLLRFLKVLGYEKELGSFNEIIRYIEEIIHEKMPSDTL